MSATPEEMTAMWEAVRAMNSPSWGVTALDVPYAALLADGSYEVRLTFKDVTHAAPWFRTSTEPTGQLGEGRWVMPAQFEDVAILSPVVSFTCRLRVRATLRREWIEWWISCNREEANRNACTRCGDPLIGTDDKTGSPSGELTGTECGDNQNEDGTYGPHGLH